MYASDQRIDTQAIVGSGHAAFHLRPEVGDPGRPYDADLSNPWVSSLSRWCDDRWTLDNPTPGQPRGYATIIWGRPLPDGSTLTDNRHAELLNAFRRFAWSLVVDPRSGKALAPGSMRFLGRGIHVLAWFMVRESYRTFGELDGKASEEFKTDLRSLLREMQADEEDEPSDPEGWDLAEVASAPEEAAREELSELGLNTALFAANIWHRLWKQSSALAEAGIPALPEVPFGNASAFQVAKELADREWGQIPWLPDEVAAPIMSAAFRLLGEPSEDVIQLQYAYLEARAEIRGPSGISGLQNARRVIENFQFSTLPGESLPWHEPLHEVTAETYWNDAADLRPSQRLRGLILVIRNAAAIVLQSCSGIRINEMCSITAGINAETGLPACISVRTSHSGTSELFYLRAMLRKTRATPTETEWLIGSRPVGDPWTPPTVRAVAVLQRLYAPWRALAGNDTRVGNSLLVSFTGKLGLPRVSESIGPITTEVLLYGQKDFVRQFVDLSNLPNKNVRGEDLGRYRDSQGTCITTHQWRKTYARYLFRTNNYLMQAISQQFKHLSFAMTEKAYIGNDPTMLRDLDTAHVRESVEFWIQFGAGTTMPVAGRMGTTIARHRSEIETLMHGKSPDESQEAIRNWVLRHDLRIFHNADGKCVMRLDPSKARCHELAGTKDWKNLAPAYAYRDTSTCLGCQAFAIDGTHSDFWVQRYRENQEAWLAAKTTGNTSGWRGVRKRADQAKAVLRVLRVEMPSVEISNAPQA